MPTEGLEFDNSGFAETYQMAVDMGRLRNQGEVEIAPSRPPEDTWFGNTYKFPTIYQNRNQIRWRFNRDENILWVQYRDKKPVRVRVDKIKTGSIPLVEKGAKIGDGNVLGEILVCSISSCSYSLGIISSRTRSRNTLNVCFLDRESEYLTSHTRSLDIARYSRTVACSGCGFELSHYKIENNKKSVKKQISKEMLQEMRRVGKIFRAKNGQRVLLSSVNESGYIFTNLKTSKIISFDKQKGEKFLKSLTEVRYRGKRLASVTMKQEGDYAIINFNLFGMLDKYYKEKGCKVFARSQEKIDLSYFMFASAYSIPRNNERYQNIKGVIEKKHYKATNSYLNINDSLQNNLVGSDYFNIAWLRAVGGLGSVRIDLRNNTMEQVNQTMDLMVETIRLVHTNLIKNPNKKIHVVSKPEADLTIPHPTST